LPDAGDDVRGKETCRRGSACYVRVKFEKDNEEVWMSIEQHRENLCNEDLVLEEDRIRQDSEFLPAYSEGHSAAT